jgi:hypothetical protein
VNRAKGLFLKIAISVPVGCIRELILSRFDPGAPTFQAAQNVQEPAGKPDFGEVSRAAHPVGKINFRMHPACLLFYPAKEIL